MVWCATEQFTLYLAGLIQLLYTKPRLRLTNGLFVKCSARLVSMGIGPLIQVEVEHVSRHFEVFRPTGTYSTPPIREREMRFCSDTVASQSSRVLPLIVFGKIIQARHQVRRSQKGQARGLPKDQWLLALCWRRVVLPRLYPSSSR